MPGSVWETSTGTNVASLTSNGFVLDLSDHSQKFGSWSGFAKDDYRVASGYPDAAIA